MERVVRGEWKRVLRGGLVRGKWKNGNGDRFVAGGRGVIVAQMLGSA